MRDGIEIIQGVLVFDVVEDGNDLHVDIYGGASNVCGTVRFTFLDPAERTSMKSVLARWQRDSTPVTFVSSDTTIALQSDAVFSEQLTSIVGTSELPEVSGGEVDS